MHDNGLQPSPFTTRQRLKLMPLMWVPLNKVSNSLFNSIGKRWCPGGESNPHEEKSPEDFKSSASAIPPPGRPLKWRGSVYGICGSSTTSGTARGKNEKTPRLAPRMCSETRIMLLLKEILPEARQRNMLLAL